MAFQQPVYQQNFQNINLTMMYMVGLRGGAGYQRRQLNDSCEKPITSSITPVTLERTGSCQHTRDHSRAPSGWMRGEQVLPDPKLPPAAQAQQDSASLFSEASPLQCNGPPLQTACQSVNCGMNAWEPTCFQKRALFLKLPEIYSLGIYFPCHRT